MAWTKNTISNLPAGARTTWTESVSLPSSTGDGYTSEIDFIKPDFTKEEYKVGVTFTLSGLAGTNVDVAIEGAVASGGTKVTLLDAPVVDFTASGTKHYIFDLNDYPMVVYYFKFTVDANEAANSMSTTIVVG